MEMVYTPTKRYPDVYKSYRELLSDIDRNLIIRLALFIFSPATACIVPSSKEMFLAFPGIFSLYAKKRALQ